MTAYGTKTQPWVIEEEPAPQRLALGRQPASLIIRKPDPFALEMLTKYPILLLKVLHDLLLLPIQPARQRHHQNRPRL